MGKWKNKIARSWPEEGTQIKVSREQFFSYKQSLGSLYQMTGLNEEHLLFNCYPLRLDIGIRPEDFTWLKERKNKPPIETNFKEYLDCL